MSLFSSRKKNLTLDDQVAALREEIASLAQIASRRGKSAYKQSRSSAADLSSGAADLYDDLADALADALPALRKQTQVMSRTVREHPTQTVAIAGLVIAGLAAVALFSRR